MLHGIVTLVYFIYTVFSGRFVQLPSILLLFQIPYILTLVLLSICTFVSLFATMLIGRRDLRTSIWDGGAGVPGLNEDFYPWLFKWGIIALTSVQEATFLNENEALRMPRSTIVENSNEQDLGEEHAIRSGIGFRREWIRTGAVAKSRGDGIPTRTQNFRSALYFIRATVRTYIALILRYLRGEDSRRSQVRAATPYSVRGMTPYDEDDDPDYVFSDRETSPTLSDYDDSYKQSVHGDTPTPGPSMENTPIPKLTRASTRNREESPFNRQFREPSPFLQEIMGPPDTSRRLRGTTPFDTLESNPPSSYNSRPPSVISDDEEEEEEEEEEDHNHDHEIPSDPLSELFPDIATTLSSLNLNPKTHNS